MPSVSIDCVTEEAHFTDDLGADWLDRLELMMVVEDQLAGLEITDADVGQIEVVGDLIRYIKTVDKERRRRGAAPVIRKLFGPRLARAMKPTKQQEKAASKSTKLRRGPGSPFCLVEQRYGVALAMNAPMQVSSSNSLISLAMTSSPGAAPAKPQLGAGTLVPRRHADRWVLLP